LERAITRIWASVLPVGDAARIGVTDSLFSLGGDSVLATAIAARLRDELDIPAVSVRMLFAAPTIAGLTDEILATEQTPARLERVAEIFLEIDALSGDEVDAQLGEAVTGG
ncbi:MAG: phosphopantetheine-binding protein, partial [Actinobacteria bacterium]|nr:phosphopantetheine-binding protein [Actinomycetota bacterium]